MLLSAFPIREQSKNSKAKTDTVNYIRKKFSWNLKPCNTLRSCSNPFLNSLRHNILFFRTWFCNWEKLYNKEILLEQILDWWYLLSRIRSRNCLLFVQTISGIRWMRIKELSNQDGTIKDGLRLKLHHRILNQSLRWASPRFKIIRFPLWKNAWGCLVDSLNKHILNIRKISAIRMINSHLILLNWMNKRNIIACKMSVTREFFTLLLTVIIT